MSKKNTNNKKQTVGIKVAQIGLIATIISAIIGLIGVIINSTFTYLEKQPIVQTPTIAIPQVIIGSPSETLQASNSNFPGPKINPLPNNIYGKIAFLRTDPKNEFYIIANSDGSDEFIVTQASWSIYCPRIAPGGEKIVFSSAYEGRESIYTINRDGSNLKKIANPTGAEHYECASWSPDETQLIYTRRHSNDADIYIMDRDGSDQKNLTGKVGLLPLDQNYFTEFPWSPTGKEIVFHSDRDGDLELYVMDKDGKNLTQITNNSEISDYGGVWAPNRDEIAFVSTSGVDGETDIFTLDLRDSNNQAVNITNNSYHDTDPIWSPDGTQILFISNRDGNREVYIMNSDGSNVRKITNTSEDEDNPSWLR